MQAKFTDAINQICDEKNISRDVVMETIKAALVSAYRKDYGSKNQEVRVEINEETGAIDAYVSKEVVETVEDKMTQISPEEAKKLKKTAKIGDMVEIHDVPADFGRIAAQTAKQVIIQRIREAERDMVFEEFKDKEGSIVNGVVQRVEGDTVIVDLGKTGGILYRSEQISSEHYYVGQRVKVFVIKVESSAKGPQVVLSRAHPDMVKRLFELEVPEILAGTIEIKAIAREAGERTKVAVYTEAEGVDPVGALVGQRGSRVQSVTNELGGEEKIDIILWDSDIKTFVTNALSPAKAVEILVADGEKKVTVKVPEDQLSLAIGKKGQNVRLAAKLTGWNVDISGGDESGIEKTATVASVADTKKTSDIEEEILKSIESQDGEEAETVEENQTDKELAKEVTPDVSETNEPAQAEPKESDIDTEEDIKADKDLAEEVTPDVVETSETALESEKLETEEESSSDASDGELSIEEVLEEEKEK